MKKKLLVGLLAAFATVSLASCDNETPTVKSLSATGQDVEFTVGEAFNVGDLKVTATMSDNTTVDVTELVTIDQNADMNKPGSYAVLISYEGQVIAYQINVVAKENVATLESINVVADNAKTYYLIGEEFTTEGVVVYETYNNSTGDDTVSTVTDLSNYSVQVTDSEGTVVSSSFAEYGIYTVTVSKGELSDTYNVTVGQKIYSSVSSALTEGLANSDKINGGFVSIDTDGYVQEYEYAFGQNYTMIVNGTDEYHYELLEDGSVFGVNCYVDFYGDFYKTYISEPGVENLLGVELSSVFGYEHTVYGVDELLNKLVELSTSEGVSNYKESFSDYCPICGIHKAYSFSFEVVMGEYNPAVYAFDVEFKIDDTTKAISDVNVVVSSTSYIYDETTGNYVPNIEATGPDYVKYITIQQEIGERNIENSHSASVYRFESFTLVDEFDNEVVDNSVVDIKVGGSAYFYLNNVTPETADPNIDAFLVNVTTEAGEETWSAGGNYDSELGCVRVYSYKTGKFNVTISTANVTYHVVLNVDYAELTDFAPGLYDQYGEVYEAYSGTTYVDQALVFTSSVNSNANPQFTATLADGTNATLEANGNDYIFTASAVGEYTINLVSSVNENLISTLTIFVEEAPNMAEIMNGKYIFDNFGQIISFVFTPETDGALNGSLVINSNNTDYNFTYTYFESFGALQVLPVDATAETCEWSVSVENYELCALYYGYFNYGPLSREDDSTEDTPSGTYENPIELTAGDFVANAPAYDFAYYTYTATVDTEITITVTSLSFFYEHSTVSFDLCDWGFNNVLTKTLTAGQTLYFKIQTETGEAGLVEFTVTLPQPEVSTPEGSGNELDPYILTLDQNYSCNAFISGYIYYKYTAQSDIDVVLEVTSNDFWFEYGVYSFGLCDNVNSENKTMNVSLTAGQTLYVKVSTASSEEAVVTFTFKSSSSTGGNEEEPAPSDAVEIIASTTPMAATFLDKETVTYVTTIGGGNSGCFGLYGELESYFITITFESDLTLYGGSPMMPMTYTSGQVIEVMANDGFIFWFDNSANLTDATVTFTVTIY